MLFIFANFLLDTCLRRH